MDDPWERTVWLFICGSPKTKGYVVRFYLNTSQVVRGGDNVRFRTKMIHDNKKQYLEFILEREPEEDPRSSASIRTSGKEFAQPSS